jgi:glycosyltransferase involved in cell wall biosynthesis
MNSEPMVSIIMNCHNSEHYLKEAIDSVYEQTYSNWEIIFWDNASTDNSSTIAQLYDTKLKYYRGSSLVSLYTARNLALEKCQGEAIGFLDCDDVWLKNKLERQIKKYRIGSKFVYGGYEIIDQFSRLTNRIVDRNIVGRITNDLLKFNHISIGCVLIDAELLKRETFDPAYELLGDFDLWVRLSMKTNADSIEGIVEYSRQHGDNYSYKLKDRWFKERRYFYRKFLQYGSVLKYPGIFRYILMTEVKGILGRV